MNLLEQDIWLKVQRGDLKSFRVLFDSYYKGLYNYAYDYLRRREDSEELVLDLFQKIWAEKETISINCSVKSYLYRSIHNSCLNFIRHNAAEKRRIVKLGIESNADELSHTWISDNIIIDNLSAAEMERDIEAAIDNLPEQCRRIFKMSRFEQMKIKEIADRMNLSESTVKTQIARALDKIREALGRTNF